MADNRPFPFDRTINRMNGQEANFLGLGMPTRALTREVTLIGTSNNKILVPLGTLSARIVAAQDFTFSESDVEVLDGVTYGGGLITRDIEVPLINSGYFYLKGGNGDKINVIFNTVRGEIARTRDITPKITVIGSISAFDDTYYGTLSDVKQFAIECYNLKERVLVAVPDGFLIKMVENDTWSSEFYLYPTLGMLTQSFHIVFTPSIVDTYSGNISFSSTDMVTEEIAVSGEGVKAELTLSSTIDRGQVIVGADSAEGTFTITGTNIIDSVTIGTPEDFLISEITGEGYDVEDIVLTPVEGVIDATIYYIFRPTEIKAYSALFTAATTDDITDTVCSGEGIEDI